MLLYLSRKQKEENMFQQKQHYKYFQSPQNRDWKNNKHFQPFQKEVWKERKQKRIFFNRKSLQTGWPKKLKSACHNKKQRQFRFGQQGQGLIEYLILVALMGVATIGIMRTLNQTVKSRFANAIYALQGRNQKASTHNMRKEEYQRSDLSNFMSGSSSSDKKRKRAKK